MIRSVINFLKRLIRGKPKLKLVQSTVLRPATEEDLKKFRFNPTATCSSCLVGSIERMGAYRLPDYYICRDCFLEKTRFEHDC